MNALNEKTLSSLPELESQMLGALELLHYSYRFCDARFVIAFESVSSLDKLLLDLRVLAVSHISPILLFPESPELKSIIETLQLRGAPFTYNDNPKALLDGLERGSVPVCCYPSSLNELERDYYAWELCDTVEAKKFFLVGSSPGVFKNEKLLSHPSPEEISDLLEGTSAQGFPTKRLAQLHQLRSVSGREVIIIDDAAGSIFQEIFSHRGKGTLLADQYENVIREATTADAHQISLLMRPYRHDGSILPTEENSILDTISDFLVYTVDGQVVAAAKLTSYGDAAELAKFSTLPRYQGRGRARELARELIAEAKRRQKKMVFALSIEPKMWQFFLRLGFHEVERESLPREWKQKYDFSRPSKAFRLDLG